MGGEEDNTGVNANPDGVEAETKVLTSTGEPLQRQRWQMHVRQVMSCLAERTAWSWSPLAVRMTTATTRVMVVVNVLKTLMQLDLHRFQMCMMTCVGRHENFPLLLLQVYGKIAERVAGNYTSRVNVLDKYVDTYLAVAKALKAVVPDAAFGPSNMAGISGDVNAGAGGGGGTEICTSCSYLNELCDQLRSTHGSKSDRPAIIRS